MKEEVADYAIKESMELLNQKTIDEWLPVDWEKWGEFVIITKKTKSDAFNIIRQPFERFFIQVERYFDIIVSTEEKERLYHKPSTFNSRGYRMGSPQHANFVEPGVDAILGYCHTLHLLLYESFEKIELQRKGIVGLIKKNNEMEERLLQYKDFGRERLEKVVKEEEPVAEEQEVVEEVEPEAKAVADVSEVEELKEKLRKKNKTIKKLREKAKKT